MDTLYLLLGLGLIGWLIWRSQQAAQQATDVESRVSQLEDELHQLRRELRSAPAPSPATATETTAEASTLARLVETRSAVVPPEPVVAAPPTASRPPALPPFLTAVETPATPPPPLAPRRVVVPESLAPRRTSTPRAPINWEQFMGVKLFSWIGGLALFLGVAFFIKYSFDHDLIPPAVRVALGFLTGLGLIVGGVLLQRKALAVTAQTLCATGVVVLYAVTFGAHRFYDLIGPTPTFLLMILVTAAGFLLAVRMDARVVAILGMLGGFLTPPLLATGQDNPLGLFGYVALLDVGLIAVALHRRWNFLVVLGALGTVLMEIGWAAKFFEPEKVFVAFAAFLTFNVLFLGAVAAAKHWREIDRWFGAAAAALPFVTLAFTFYLLTFDSLGARPGAVFAFALGADLCLLGLVLLHARWHAAQLVAGLVVFLQLAVWTSGHLTNELLNWGLALYLVFAVLHALFPIVLQRLRPGAAPVWWGHLFPPLALLLVMVSLFRGEPSFLVWPVVLLVDALAIGLAVLSASVLAIAAVLVLTVLATAIWVLRIPAEITGLPDMLFVIGSFALFFFVAGFFAVRKILPRLAGRADDAAANPATAFPWQLPGAPADWLAHLPAMSAILPFLLLVLVVARLPVADPAPVFGLALLLVVLLLGLARHFKLDSLNAVGLACVLVLEHVWQGARLQPEHAVGPLAWHLVFYAVFALYPFLFRAAVGERTLPWAVAALSGPLHFYLVQHLVTVAFPGFRPVLGLLPAAFAVPALLGLVVLLRTVPATQPGRLTQLAWFGGAALFFITLIFPIQFDRQWITLGWALEGAALLWLFHRVPHPGLRATGAGLLAVAFGRLALNPAVLEYHARSATPIINWYLYTYGVTTLCLFAGARLLAPPRHQIRDANVPPMLNALGTVLAFLLLNLEIADYFTAAGNATLTFEFSGNFARDMTYSIAWALFALGLLIVGIRKRISAVRYAALGLLAVTLLKLFFHDLSRLDSLYRIGALIGVAVIAMLASFLYQRFLATDIPPDETHTPPPSPS